MHIAMDSDSGDTTTLPGVLPAYLLQCLQTPTRYGTHAHKTHVHHTARRCSSVRRNTPARQQTEHAPENLIASGSDEARGHGCSAHGDLLFRFLFLVVVIIPLGIGIVIVRIQGVFHYIPRHVVYAIQINVFVFIEIFSVFAQNIEDIVVTYICFSVGIK